jgi:hypothetical protein
VNTLAAGRRVKPATSSWLVVVPFAAFPQLPRRSSLPCRRRARHTRVHSALRAAAPALALRGPQKRVVTVRPSSNHASPSGRCVRAAAAARRAAAVRDARVPQERACPRAPPRAAVAGRDEATSLLAGRATGPCCWPPPLAGAAFRAAFCAAR